MRRERLGHINLASPVAHIWFLKSLPSRIGNILDITLKDLEKVLYCEAYIVIDPMETGLEAGELLTEERYAQLLEEYGDDRFEAGMGGEAILEMLKRVEVHSLAETLRQDMREATFETDYHLIVSMGCLHLLERECWGHLLRRMQAHTCVGGYHAVGIMTDALPAPDDQREFFIGLFEDGELFEQYAGWEIISRRSVQFHDEHPNGVRHHHAGDNILARKL